MLNTRAARNILDLPMVLYWCIFSFLVQQKDSVQQLSNFTMFTIYVQ